MGPDTNLGRETVNWICLLLSDNRYFLRMWSIFVAIVVMLVKSWKRQTVYLKRNAFAQPLLPWNSSIRYSEYVCIFWSYLSSIQSACGLLYCHLWPVWLYYFFPPHYLINGKFFDKKFVWIFNFSSFLSQTYFDLRRNERDVIIFALSYSWKLPFILVWF